MMDALNDRPEVEVCLGQHPEESALSPDDLLTRRSQTRSEQVGWMPTVS